MRELAQRQRAVAVPRGTRRQTLLAPLRVRLRMPLLPTCAGTSDNARAQRAPRRAARRHLHVVMREHARGLGEGVQLRRLRVGDAERAEVVAQVVNRDEQHVRPRRFSCLQFESTGHHSPFPPLTTFSSHHRRDMSRYA
jgi:hypothetical protein